MRELTFEGFLLRYVQELTGSRSKNLKVLLGLSLDGHSRALEPTVLLFALRGRGNAAIKLLENTPYRDNTQLIFSEGSTKEALMQLLNEDTGNPSLSRYRKVYEAYKNAKGKIAVDRKAILLMREKIVSIMVKKGLSNYRVYSDLGLNPGNVNSYLKNKNATKVSRKTARRILDYVLAA